MLTEDQRLLRNQRAREYRANNRERVLEIKKQYYKNNRDIILERNKRDYILNQEKRRLCSRLSYYKKQDEYKLKSKIRYNANRTKILIKNQEWYKNNKHKRSLYSRFRHTRLEQSIPRWFEKDLVERIYNKRDELNELWGVEMEVDHIIPINPRDQSVCGLHCWSNLQLLDATLNQSKGSCYETDW